MITGDRPDGWLRYCEIEQDAEASVQAEDSALSESDPDAVDDALISTTVAHLLIQL